MDLGIAERTALVAASTAGLGLATARQLAREGAHVMICGRDPDRLQEALDELQKEGGQVLGTTADVTRNEDIDKLVERTESKFGPVDILVTNAGGPPATTLADLTPELWQEAIELNLVSSIQLATRVLPSMRSRKWGRIVMIASVAAKQPIDNLILSNTARAGVLGYAKTLSNLVAGDDVLVNAVLPGYTRTQRLVSLVEQEEGATFRQWEQAIPMGRLGEPAEFADVVTFLCSERASYVTGVALQVDGGLIKTIT